MGALSQTVSGGPFVRPNSNFDPRMVARRWGLVTGLMAGIAQAHVVQPIAAWTGLLSWQPKLWVSLAGAVLYSLCFALLRAGKIAALVGRAVKIPDLDVRLRRVGLWITVVGPLVGLAAVTTGVVLAHLGVISGFRGFDAFQLSGGVLQVAALAIAVVLLRRKS